MTTRIVIGDALISLRELPDESVHSLVTSPPYWGLRAYGGEPGMIGLEPTFDDHLENLVAVFREARRVLRKDGTLWLNYGDAYARSWGAQSRGYGDPSGSTGLSGGQVHAAPKGTHRCSRKRTGLKPKDLMMMPARVAMALQEDGWWLRSEIVWHKPNPMPESATDRPTNAHEKLFLLSKSGSASFWTHPEYRGVRAYPKPDRYWRHNETRAETREEPENWWTANEWSKLSYWRGYDYYYDAVAVREVGQSGTPGHRNHRNVWTIATTPYCGEHFATFPPDLVKPCIKAATSEKGVCRECGAPWVRIFQTEYRRHERWFGEYQSVRHSRGVAGQSYNEPIGTITKGWSPTCGCDAGNPVPATVLDPFAGAGTVGLVADQLGRCSILIEINSDYAEMARSRIEGDAPLLSEVATE